MQELKFDNETNLHVLETFPKIVDIGLYTFSFEVFLSISLAIHSRSLFHEFNYYTYSDNSLPFNGRFFFMILKIKSSMPPEDEQKYLFM